MGNSAKKANNKILKWKGEKENKINVDQAAQRKSSEKCRISYKEDHFQQMEDYPKCCSNLRHI
jgi:hypothetical protein